MTDIPVSSASTPSGPSSPEKWRALVASWRAAAEDRTADHAGYLRSAARAADGSLPCHLIANYALAWYAASERVTDPTVHDEIITAFEAAADRLGDPGPCDHAAHPRLGHFEDYLPTAAWLGTPLGRRAYRWRRHEEGGEPLDAWLCPSFLRVRADEALAALRPARAALRS
ncbi:hypothetical protein [Actinomadura kijaniata]|uniref:hypothetical protein n=1 Tax=Actinomadura kijaniata TaxID=46161 RepID=UPI00082E287C|nr:hypothetical protein [Actinomadura kijaniata]